MMNSIEDEVIPDSPVPNSPMRSNVETSIHVIIYVVSSKVSTPVQIVLTPPPVSTIETSRDQGTSHLVVSSTFDTSTIDTSTSLPPFVYTPIVAHSPTFDNVLKQPITSLFSSQSTDPLVTHEEEQTPYDDEENEFDGTFADIQFDMEEENIPDNMILTRKQFKIVNRKLKSLLQIQADG
ncbi:unnamed protein product [Lactuca saligna]|uniref:Uncharacterized protein n=1 Tax=Lactuca saligna TaxID=75948 RepID=A0AA35YDP6_LACSI|nr:unnamed protein product [Lactuca saligna]